MYYNENTIVYYKGNYIKAAKAKGNVYDQSLHYGYAVFEGIRAYNTEKGVKIFKAEEHYKRMQFSCEAVGIPYPFNNKELIDISYEVLKRNGFSDAYIRPLVTCTPNMTLCKGIESELLIAAWEWGAYLGDKMVNLKISSFRRPNPNAFAIEAKVSGHYVNSILASQEAKDAGFDEALLLDVNGFIAEGPGANFFVEKDHVLYTPSKGNILPGITRATVIEICQELEIELVEKQILPEEVLGADAAFFCGKAAEVVGIQSLDGIPFTKLWSASLGAIIQQAYKNKVLHKELKSLLQPA
jgi:branched-chain amino acid aminotransferase